MIKLIPLKVKFKWDFSLLDTTIIYMALSTTQLDTVKGLLFIETDIPNKITYNTVLYPTILSISGVERMLDNGGFVIDRSLTATLRIYNKDGSKQFNTLPSVQDILTYNGDRYRILSIKVASTQTHFRLIGIGITRGL